MSWRDFWLEVVLPAMLVMTMLGVLIWLTHGCSTAS